MLSLRESQRHWNLKASDWGFLLQRLRHPWHISASVPSLPAPEVTTFSSFRGSIRRHLAGDDEVVPYIWVKQRPFQGWQLPWSTIEEPRLLLLVLGNARDCSAELYRDINATSQTILFEFPGQTRCSTTAQSSPSSPNNNARCWEEYLPCEFPASDTYQIAWGHQKVSISKRVLGLAKNYSGHESLLNAKILHYDISVGNIYN